MPAKRGRKSIGFKDYEKIVKTRIASLEARMALVDNQKSKQWQNMRK